MTKEFMSNNMNILKEDYPDLYESIVLLNNTIENGKSLDKKTQKLIAIGIAAGSNNESTTRQQMKHGIKYYDITKDEIIDVLRIVLLLTGKPSFTKSIGILYSLIDEK